MPGIGPDKIPLPRLPRLRAKPGKTPTASQPSATPERPRIEVKWESARRYSFHAHLEGAEISLSNRPKGWNLGDPDEKRPPSVSRPPRQGLDGDITYRASREKTELHHFITEVGPGETQGRLSYKPVLSRPPSPLERQVMDDFLQAMEQAGHDSKGKQGPLHGEFIATYSKSKNIETGAIEVDRTSFAFNAANTIPVPESGVRPDFVIHSHPYDPERPKAAGPCEPLGGSFPSGADRHLAMARSETGIPPPVQMFMHGGQVFLIHGDDLHFTLLDPAAKGRKFFAHPDQGPGWDQDLFLTPHPTPPT